MDGRIHGYGWPDTRIWVAGYPDMPIWYTLAGARPPLQGLAWVPLAWPSTAAAVITLTGRLHAARYPLTGLDREMQLR